jgi:hypothetical protein
VVGADNENGYLEIEGGKRQSAPENSEAPKFKNMFVAKTILNKAFSLRICASKLNIYSGRGMGQDPIVIVDNPHPLQ